MDSRIEYRDRVDHKMIFIIISLIAFGLVMMCSIFSAQDNIKPFFKQLGCMAGCFVCMCIFYRFKLDFLNKWAKVLYIAAILMILALLLPEPFTRTANGATRWLNFKFFVFQVAEFVKLAVVLMLAHWIEYSRERRGIREEISFILVAWLIGGAPSVLLMNISNDLSSSMVILGITFVMSFVASRGKIGWIMHILAVLGVIAFVAYYVYDVKQNMPLESQILANEVSFRRGRIAAWLDPERYAGSVGYQPLHCLYAVANGGWFGKGLGQSWQKAILPESENDAVFAIIIEELGIFGGLVLIFLFAVLVTLIARVAYNTEDLFGRMFCVGVASHIMLQVLIHCGVCTNMLPNTGIGLPFISSGLTASIFQLVEMTVVMSIAYVHIFDNYDLSKRRAREKQYKTQKYFTGRRVRQKEAHERAMQQARLRADQEKSAASSSGRRNAGSGQVRRTNTEISRSSYRGRNATSSRSSYAGDSRIGSREISRRRDATLARYEYISRHRAKSDGDGDRRRGRNASVNRAYRSGSTRNRSSLGRSSSENHSSR